MKRVLFTIVFVTSYCCCNAQTVNIHLKNGEVIKYESERVDYVDFSEKEETPINPQDPSDPSNPTEDPANYDITNYITAYFSGGSISQNNDHINSGSQLNWTFNNGSKYSVVLTGIQLIDGVTGTTSSNLLNENAIVEAGESVTYTITVGILGVSKPSVRFSYIYNDNLYATEAVYKEFNFPF